MVAESIIDVKIAVPTSAASPNAKRLFHDKVGLFTDSEGNRVGFRGSMNETFKGLSSDGNMESIDVFPSWMDERDQDRVDSAADFFEKLCGMSDGSPSGGWNDPGGTGGRPSCSPEHHQRMGAWALHPRDRSDPSDQRHPELRPAEKRSF